MHTAYKVHTAKKAQKSTYEKWNFLIFYHNFKMNNCQQMCLLGFQFRKERSECPIQRCTVLQMDSCCLKEAGQQPASDMGTFWS